MLASACSCTRIACACSRGRRQATHLLAMCASASASRCGACRSTWPQLAEKLVDDLPVPAGPSWLLLRSAHRDCRKEVTRQASAQAEGSAWTAHRRAVTWDLTRATILRRPLSMRPAQRRLRRPRGVVRTHRTNRYLDCRRPACRRRREALACRRRLRSWSSEADCCPGPLADARPEARGCGRPVDLAPTCRPLDPALLTAAGWLRLAITERVCGRRRRTAGDGRIRVAAARREASVVADCRRRRR